jgi:DNA-binding response OmpR family regulator
MKTILVVEDDLDIIDIVELILTVNGYAVIAISKKITTREIAELSPDLVLVDFLLPFGLGDQLCLAIKNYELTKHIPVILYSASSNLAQIVRGCKADAYITKPFDMDDLLSEIKMLIDRDLQSTA